MDIMQLKDLGREDLLRQLEDGARAERLSKDYNFQLVLEAAERVAKFAKEALVDCDPTDVATIIRLQERAKYERFLRNLIDALIAASDVALTEANDIKKQFQG